MFVECPFCHKRVLRFWFANHSRQHTQLRDDGQMADHLTQPVDQRYQGSLDDVPQVYQHPACGHATGMPEEIIRSYLANPFLYSDKSFCTGCGDYVDCRELYWVDTGESLYDYNSRLRSEHGTAERPEVLNANRIQLPPLSGFRRALIVLITTLAAVMAAVIWLLVNTRMGWPTTALEWVSCIVIEVTCMGGFYAMSSLAIWAAVQKPWAARLVTDGLKRMIRGAVILIVVTVGYLALFGT